LSQLVKGSEKWRWNNPERGKTDRQRAKQGKKEKKKRKKNGIQNERQKK